MPKHWREKNPGSQIWFVGQAVAAREMSWQLSNQATPDRELAERWAGLLWVLGCEEQPTANLISPDRDDFERAKVSYDRFAKQYADGESSMDTAKAVGWLAGSSNTRIAKIRPRNALKVLKTGVMIASTISSVRISMPPR